MSPPDPDRSLPELLAARDVVVVCGSGGVGKTTIAASMAAMAAAEHGGRVLVLTIDPARRLATALGLQALGNVEVRIDDEQWAGAGVEPGGELWAAMLDTKASWDDLVSQHAPDAATRDAIVLNPLYRNITGTFVQSHDYIAMERLHELHASGRYDLIVVDTPPARHAIDFLSAPERMADFFSSRLLRWLIAPYRSRVVTAASRPFSTVADRILGSQFLEDIAEFFILFRTMYDGFVERADAVSRTLRDPRTGFVVVTTLEPAPAREAGYFVDELERRGFALGAIVCNKVLPDLLRRDDAALAARALARHAPELADALDPEGAAALARVLREVGERFADYAMVARREVDQARDLAHRSPVVASVPHLDHDVADLGGLLEVGRQVWRDGGTQRFPRHPE